MEINGKFTARYFVLLPHNYRIHDLLAVCARACMCEEGLSDIRGFRFTMRFFFFSSLLLLLFFPVSNIGHTYTTRSHAEICKNKEICISAQQGATYLRRFSLKCRIKNISVENVAFWWEKLHLCCRA